MYQLNCFLDVYLELPLVILVVGDAPVRILGKLSHIFLFENFFVQVYVIDVYEPRKKFSLKFNGTIFLY